MINKEVILDFLKDQARDAVKDKTSIATTIFVVIGALFIGGYYFNGWYTNRVESAAQLAFTESLDIYNQALSKELMTTDKATNEWDESDLAFKTAYDQNKNSKLSPFFLVYQAQSLAREGEIEKAVSILDEAIDDVSNDLHFFNLFKLTKNLILFNGSTEDKTSALKDLEALASDKDNPLQDMSLYFLAEYYYSEGDLEKAKDLFQRASELGFKNELNVESPWVGLSKEKLASL
ncbi:hypothetical protein A3F66_06275 [candidate division TM6 bacterium RIFCSPHIGHO2_12_FULL_32_22]|nr:MAG: hypothetical protein A3F66_06275 [candidate division TM6 bacterium RIFCSPHIGHO2_12_FULL_32_22]